MRHILFIGIILLTSIARADYKPLAGPFDTLLRRDVVLHDAARKKDVRVTVSFPDTQGTFPVIVFSHGYGASGAGYSKLTRAWASAGYIVLAPDHADANAL